MAFGTIRTILGVKIPKIFFHKNGPFLGVFNDPNDSISIHMNGKRITNSKSVHKITPECTKTRKMTYDVIKRH